MYNPKVSIVIPVYNGANYLGEAIESALAQTYNNREIIVVNDGSNDNGSTEAVAKSYGEKIRYITKENGGVSSALNLGIQNAAGEWISWLSHDDLYTSNKIEVQINDVIQAKNSGKDYKRLMYYCQGGFINSSGTPIERKQKTLSTGFYKSNDMLMNLFKGYSIGGCGLLIPKSMFDEIDGFDEDMRYMQDVFMWEKAFLAGYGLFINENVMSITRVHSMQVSSTGKAYGIKDREKVGMFLCENLGGISDSNGNNILKQYMYLCMRNNSTNIGNIIFSKLRTQKEVLLYDTIKFYCMKIYGSLRKVLTKIYYKIKFNAKR